MNHAILTLSVLCKSQPRQPTHGKTLDYIVAKAIVAIIDSFGSNGKATHDADHPPTNSCAHRLSTISPLSFAPQGRWNKGASVTRSARLCVCVDLHWHGTRTKCTERMF